MQRPLTAKQRCVLDYVAAQIATGLPPTRAEITRAMGYRSQNAAEDHLRALQRKGYLQLLHTPRGIKLTAAVRPDKPDA